MNDSYCRNSPWLVARSLSGSFCLLQNALLVPLDVSSKNRFYLPNILLMRGRSALLISPSSAKRRFLLADFFSRMWFLPCLRRTSLPEPLVLNLFLAPLCVFILGITFPYRRVREFCFSDIGASPRSLGVRIFFVLLSALFRCLIGTQDHGHVAAV